MQGFSILPAGMFSALSGHRRLLATLVKREVIGRYRGSVMGLLWSFLNPLMLLIVYTFVFSVVFRARWSAGSESRTEFAIVLFAGLLVYNLFSECVTRAPSLIIANSNYVKRVVFPLEILPWISLGAALFHTGVSFLVWLLFYVVIFGLPPATALLFPIVLIPLVLLTLGISWFLASLGVYLRDVTQVIGVVTTAMLFLSPIFFPVSALPADLQPWIYLNPLTAVIERARDVLIWGRLPEATSLGWSFVVSAAIAWLGFAWFQKTRRGFADVL